MQRRRTSIATFVIFTLVAVTTLLLGGLGVLSYLSESADQRAKLETETDTMAQQLAAGLALPLWNFDRPQVDRVIESVMQAPQVAGVVVRQKDVSAPGGTAIHARARDAQWKTIAAEGPPSTAGLIAKELPVTVGGELLGSVKIFATPMFAIRAMNRSLLFLVVRIVSLDLMLVVILYLLLRQMVIRPLQAVEAFASAVSSDERKFPATNTHFSGELESLCASIEKMIALLDARYAALQKSQAMLSGILNTVPQAIFWKDREGRYLGGNQVFIQTAGVKRLDMLPGMTDFEMPWAAAAERYRAYDAEVIRSGQPRTHIVESAMRAGGKVIWADTSKMPLIDAEGNIYGVLGIYDDITERKRAEEALRFNEEQYRVLFEQDIVGIVICDTIGDEAGEPSGFRVVQANPAFNRLTGLKREEQVGKTDREVGWQWPADLQRQLLALAFNGGTLSYERYNESIGRHYEVRAFSPKRGQFAMIFNDVSERKRAQALMLESEKMRTVAGLAAGMAHEINNPLAGILQSAEVVVNRVSVDVPANRAAAEECGTRIEAVQAYMNRRGIIELLNTIQSSGHRAAEIVANMLAFSRKGKSQTRPCSLAELLDQTIALASSDYDRDGGIDFRSIELVHDYDASLPEVSCHPTELQQVVLNLLKNAAQAMNERGVRDDRPRIIVRTRRVNGRAQIEVEDNGPGIPEALRRQVFEPFFTTKETKGGTGLGLFVAYIIVTRNHGGEFEVSSTPGRGTKFTITLPLENIE